MKDFIEKFLHNGNLLSNFENVVAKQYPSEYATILDSFPEYTNFRDKAYAFVYGVKRCKVCGNAISLGWQTRNKIYCSPQCKRADKEHILAKSKATCMERYGVDVPAKSADIKAKMQATTMERYGVGNIMQSPEYLDSIGYVSPMARPEVQAKSKHTLTERYGDRPYANSTIVGKRKATCMERYGVDVPAKSADIKAKMQATTMERYGVGNYSQSQSYKDYIKDCRRAYVESLGLAFNDELLVGSPSQGYASKEFIEAQLNGTVTIAQTKGEYSDYHYALRNIETDGKISSPHRMLLDFLDSYNIAYKANDRVMLKPKELDIYIPAHNLAIEINGIYWHSVDVPVTDTKHLDKFQQCTNLGIKLLQFTDLDIYCKFELIKSMVLARCGLSPNRIMARKCSVDVINRETAQQLLEQWHYQGKTTNSAKFVGLVYNNEIVAMLAYSTKDTTTRIERFACKPFHHVVGAYTKLEAQVIKLTNPTHIVTFSLGLISDGALYSNNGYTPVGQSTRPEFYVYDGVRLHNRQRFMKSKMPTLFGDKFNPNFTEFENIVTNGLRLYFGAGITKWVKYV